MVNNFDIIKNELKFDNEGDFYFVQILKRKKENPEIKGNSKIIKSFYIKSLEKFASYKDEIIKLCDNENARCYINLNRRNEEKISKQMLVELATNVANNQFNNKGLYDSCCGKYSSEKRENQKWIIDFDSKDNDLLINTYNCVEKVGGKIYCILPTANGFHIITSPFNVMEFLIEQDYIKKEDIKKDRFALLYVNKQK